MTSLRLISQAFLLFDHFYSALLHKKDTAAIGAKLQAAVYH